MKTLLKLAVGAAIAGALVNMLMKQTSGNDRDDFDASVDDLDAPASTAGYTVEELVMAGEPETVAGAEELQEPRGLQPVLNS